MYPHRRLGCGVWVVWLMLIVFGGEWLLLSAVIKGLPQTQVPVCVFGVILLTIIGGWAAVTIRVQRRKSR